MLLSKNVSFRKVLHVSDELGFVSLVDLVQSEDVFFKLLFKKLKIYFLFGVEISRSCLLRLDLVLVFERLCRIKVLLKSTRLGVNELSQVSQERVFNLCNLN